MSAVDRVRRRNSRNGTWVPEYQDRRGPTTPTTPPLGPPTDEHTGEQANEAVLELREKAFILRGTASPTYANPHINAGRPINIQGIGSVFSGLYNVTNVKHTINKTSGYSMVMNVARNATGEGARPNVPASQSESVTRLPTPVANTPTPAPIYHTVQRGDTLWAIAKRYLGNGALFTRIVAVNPLITNPSRISVGTRLLIPPR